MNDDRQMSENQYLDEVCAEDSEEEAETQDKAQDDMVINKGCDVKYPEIEVELIGHDGNSYAILGKVIKALRRGNVSPNEVEAFQAEAMDGDYDHLLRTCMKWVNVS